MPDWVTREAYSQEVCSCGFWPGNEDMSFASFYSNIYPEPKGLKSVPIKPESAYYDTDLREFILPYKKVQEATNHSQVLLDFLNTTYEAAANLAGWNRENLERKIAEISKVINYAFNLNI